MKTGFENLDKIVNIEKPQVILLSSRLGDGDMLSGDIANQVCLEEKQPVLEIVHSVKEYLIKRLFVNQAKVNYQKWTLKNKYSDE